MDFQQAPYTHAQKGQTYRPSEMAEDGFTLLIMGFTGPKAAT
ncbi:Rha family transcriptional regulator [Agrobacterium sp. 22-209-1]